MSAKWLFAFSFFSTCKLLPVKFFDRDTKPYIAVNVKGEERMKETAGNYLGK